MSPRANYPGNNWTLSLETERDHLRMENAALRDCLSQLVKDIDAWEAMVAATIGRPPNATWGNLDEARRLIH